ncbi:LysE family translocator [Mangrovicoccus algicola]|uniref:LysE family translocator n=1 Tax=Mangrovicoccus algicola TaxID=2771008 RepID=A0A8J6YXU7_9RHOB|nr:LysE family translocator [Mangrovicoccus algicola]MBE3637911.1 LysE family translocator [Mangrovicoccus algicola]
MTASATDLALYAGALFVLFMTPGPVWVALLARALSGGFASAWPLALGVVIGDILWPLLAILGVSWIVSAYGAFMSMLRWGAAAIFWIMGIGLIRHAGRRIGRDSRLTRPGRWAGFAAGVAVILGNPKAILFYMGVLPGFFDLAAVTPRDIAAITALSAAVPLVGNLILAGFVHRMRPVLASGHALARMNRIAGGLLILVGCVIPFT